MAKTKVHGEYLQDSVVRFTAKAGENITKGQPVYISGISGELPVVSLADADDTAKMPAFGLAEATVSTNAEVEVTSFGTLAGLDTSSYSLGDILYVDTTAGALTNNPSGLEATKLQNIGIVQRVHAANGSIKVGGAGRTNAVPNLDNGDIFIGDSNNKAISSSLATEIESYLDGGTSTPTFGAMNANGAITLGNNGYWIGNATHGYRFNNSTDTLNLVVIKDNGNVGINTGSPSTPLHIKSDSEHQLKIEATAAAGASMQLYSAGTYAYTVYENSSANFRVGAYGGSSFVIRDQGNTSDRLTINSSGNVGIGTTSPSTNLSIFNSSATWNQYATLRLATENEGTYYGEVSFHRGTSNDTDRGLVFNLGGTERMRILNTGDISIGSSGTVYKNISASQSPTLSIDGTFPAINFKDDSGTAAFYGINGTRMYLGGNASTVDLLFYLNDAPVTKITDAGIVSTNCSTNYKGVHIHGSQAPCISFAKATADETSPEWRIGVSGYDGADLAISVGSTTGDRVRIDPNGRLLAGVENVAPRAGTTNVGNEAIQSYGPIISGAFQGSYTGGLHCIRDWFVYAGPPTNTGAYLHIKTDLPNSTVNSSYTMSLFKYRAYAYGGGGNVAEGILGWHNWSGGYYNVGIVNYNSSWALVQSSYTSSDNYVVLVAYLAASYCHLAIDWDQWGGYAFRNAKVVATTQTSSATGAY